MLTFATNASADVALTADTTDVAVEKLITGAVADVAQTDTSIAENAAKKKKSKVFVPVPKKALGYSFVPGLGLGQIYNRKYWKLPIVYAGYAALVYAVIYTNNNYRDYRKAYISIADTDESTNAYTKYIPSGQTPETVDMGWLTNALNQRYMRFRRYRDLSIIGLVAWYGLTILDAYVDAHLFHFDISESLSMSIEPDLKLNENKNVGINCVLSF